MHLDASKRIKGTTHLCVLGHHAHDEAGLYNIELLDGLGVLEHLAIVNEANSVNGQLAIGRLDLGLEVQHSVGGLAVNLEDVALERLDLDFLGR